MATNRNTLFYPRAFARPTVRTLPDPEKWTPVAGGLTTSLSIENMANYLSGFSATTYNPGVLANMTANDMRFAIQLILNYQA